MAWEIIVSVLGGFVGGLVVARALGSWRQQTASELTNEIFTKSEAEHRRQTDLMTETLRAQFGDLSLKALSRNTDDFLKLAETKLSGQTQENKQELDAKKGLIDQQLAKLAQELTGVTQLVQNLEKDRENKFGMLTNQIQNANVQTALLLKTTQSLREALANTKARGQWGERMAEDVLRTAGFVENINYRKQTKIAAGTLPDFTFILPRGLTLNMDVKFPFENYMRFLESSVEGDQQRFRQDYLRDIKAKIKEVTSRSYISSAENTVDYVLLFIPNEQIYAFIHENDPSLLDSAIAQHVVMCSPITLFAVLAVIRQAAENFAMERTTGEILKLMGNFRKQWEEFVGKMDLVGKRIADAQKEFETLTSTRRNQLERPLRQIEELRQGREAQENEALMPMPSHDATTDNPRVTSGTGPLIEI
jgi:DNA recombination protein RmuC